LRRGSGLGCSNKNKESVVSALLNIVYREYCRARLAEMRQPALLLLRAAAPSTNA
jgi:hypothetical protein